MKTALFIGIDGYSFGELSECVNDAKKISELLDRHDNGDKNFDIKVKTASNKDKPELTEGVVRAEIREFFKKTADAAVLYFSGHGVEDDLGGYLVTQRATTDEPGVAFSEVVAYANRSKIKEITIILDCCHAGHIGEWSIRGVSNQIPVAVVRQGITILSSSGAGEYSAEIKGRGGLFTSLLCEALSGGAADILGNVTVASLYSYADQLLGGWQQRPIYKSHLTSMEPLRRCTPKVEKAVLRKMTEYFKRSEDARHKLSPAYEPKALPKDEKKEAIFADLQLMRAAGLVKPDGGEDHLYFAAMKEKSCSLTPLGKFYWHLVNKQRI